MFWWWRWVKISVLLCAACPAHLSSVATSKLDALHGQVASSAMKDVCINQSQPRTHRRSFTLNYFSWVGSVWIVSPHLKFNIFLKFYLCHNSENAGCESVSMIHPRGLRARESSETCVGDSPNDTMWQLLKGITGSLFGALTGVKLQGDDVTMTLSVVDQWSYYL